MDINHVKKHYPNSIINSFKIKGFNINEFLENYIGEKIDYLEYVDLEGIDYEVLMKIDLKKISN